MLTEAVRRKPYSVVLLDEVEKAHSDVLELFFQVFDKGMLEDGEGREIDFKNTVILLTSNVGTDTIMKVCADEETRPEPAALADMLRTDLLKHFPPAFLGRLIVIPYYAISDAIMRQIIQLQLRRIQSRRAGEPSRAADVRRRPGRRDQGAVHRGGQRRPQRRAHSDPDAAAGDLARSAVAHGDRSAVCVGPHHDGWQRRISVRRGLMDPVAR